MFDLGIFEKLGVVVLNSFFKRLLLFLHLLLIGKTMVGFNGFLDIRLFDLLKLLLIGHFLLSFLFILRS
jgi:hypothetical protein